MAREDAGRAPGDLGVEASPLLAGLEGGGQLAAKLADAVALIYLQKVQK